MNDDRVQTHKGMFVSTHVCIYRLRMKESNILLYIFIYLIYLLSTNNTFIYIYISLFIFICLYCVCVYTHRYYYSTHTLLYAWIVSACLLVWPWVLFTYVHQVFPFFCLLFRCDCLPSHLDIQCMQWRDSHMIIRGQRSRGSSCNAGG
jgi:hypothetical protein